MIPVNRFLCGGDAKCYLLSTNNRRSWVPGLTSNGIERWPFLVGPTLILLCRLKSEQLKLGTHYLLCTGFVLGTSFNGLRVSVSNAFEDDEFVTPPRVPVITSSIRPGIGPVSKEMKWKEYLAPMSELQLHQ